jgi:RNA polymerase sigma-32 factor
MDITDENLTPEDYKNLAEELGVSDEAVVEMEQRMGGKDLSLNTELNNSVDTTHLDFLVDEVSNQEEIITKAEEEEKVKSELETALKSLKDRERFIIENRILRDNPLTLEELGTKLSLSRERVRQIENAALKKIKHVLEKKGISR